MTIQRYDEPDSRMQVGQTTLGADDFIPPRVKIVQQMSGEVADKKADAGDWFNTLTGETYGPKLVLTPLMTFMNRVFIIRDEHKPDANKKLVAAGLSELPDGDGLMCRSVDTVHGRGDPGIACSQCPLSEWEGRTVAPLCSEVYNLAALTELGEVVFLGFSRSSARTGKQINSILRFQSGAPSGGMRPWSKLWTAETRLVKGDKGPFYVAEVKPTKDTTPPELSADAAYWASQFTGVRFDTTEQEAAVQSEGDKPEVGLTDEPPF